MLLYKSHRVAIDISRFTLFADEITLLWQEQDEETLSLTICSDVNILKGWCNLNLMYFNMKKMNFLFQWPHFRN